MKTTDLTLDKFDIRANRGAVSSAADSLFAKVWSAFEREAKNMRLPLSGPKVSSRFDEHPWPSMTEMIWVGRLHMTYGTRPH